MNSDKKPFDLNSLGCSPPPPLFLITEKYFGSGVKKTLKISLTLESIQPLCKA